MVPEEFDGLRHREGTGARKWTREGSLKGRGRQRVLGAVLVALSCAHPLAAQDDEAAAERELARVRGVIGALHEELTAARADRTAASRALEEHERAIAAIAAEQRSLDATAQELDSQFARLRTTRQELQTRADAERDALGRQLRVAYALGREDRLKLLLERRDPGTIARLLRYHGYFSRERRERIAALESTLSRLRTTEAAIAAQARRLDEVREQRALRQQALAAERARRAQAITALDAEMSDRQARLVALERDRQRLTDLVKKLREALSDITADLEPPRSFKVLRGRLPWPVAGRVARPFGAPRQDADLAWQGVLLEAAHGQVVRAVAHGRVVFADWLRGFGQMVILDHGDGYMSLYGHNESLLREPGEWVNAGDPVATVGDSGGNAQSGLYFEIRHDGRPQDPARWCDAHARFRASL